METAAKRGQISLFQNSRVLHDKRLVFGTTVFVYGLCDFAKNVNRQTTF